MHSHLSKPNAKTPSSLPTMSSGFNNPMFFQNPVFSPNSCFDTTNNTNRTSFTETSSNPKISFDRNQGSAGNQPKLSLTASNTSIGEHENVAIAEILQSPGDSLRGSLVTVRTGQQQKMNNFGLLKRISSFPSIKKEPSILYQMLSDVFSATPEISIKPSERTQKRRKTQAKRLETVHTDGSSSKPTSESQSMAVDDDTDKSQTKTDKSSGKQQSPRKSCPSGSKRKQKLRSKFWTAKKDKLVLKLAEDYRCNWKKIETYFNDQAVTADIIKQRYQELTSNDPNEQENLSICRNLLNELKFSNEDKSSQSNPAKIFFRHSEPNMILQGQRDLIEQDKKDDYIFVEEESPMSLPINLGTRHDFHEENLEKTPEKYEEGQFLFFDANKYNKHFSPDDVPLSEGLFHPTKMEEDQQILFPEKTPIFGPQMDTISCYFGPHPHDPEPNPFGSPKINWNHLKPTPQLNFCLDIGDNHKGHHEVNRIGPHGFNPLLDSHSVINHNYINNDTVPDQKEYMIDEFFNFESNKDDVKNDPDINVNSFMGETQNNIDELSNARSREEKMLKIRTLRDTISSIESLFSQAKFELAKFNLGQFMTPSHKE